MMRVVVLGADGQLGSDFVRLLAPTIEVVPLTLADVDVTDRGGVKQALASAHPNVVLNCAGYTAVDKAESDPDSAWRVNVLGARNVAQEARRTGARIVYFSTDYVFDGTAAEPYDEDAPTGPLSVYGRTKLLGEQATREANPDHLILRLAWLYGPTGHNFARTVLRLAREKDVLRIVDDQTGSPTFTEDVVRQVLALIEDGASGTYHCVNTGRATWYEFARCIVHAAGLDTPVAPIRTVDYPTPASRPAFSVLADRKLSLEQLSVMRPWQEALNDCMMHHKEALLHD
jgi:dTDP-4-dehydrorhamnose reductase